MKANPGLTDVKTASLVELLKAVHNGTLDCPVTHPTLLKAGFPGLVDKLDHLQGLDARAVQAVLVAVIAERRAEERRAQRVAGG